MGTILEMHKDQLTADTNFGDGSVAGGGANAAYACGGDGTSLCDTLRGSGCHKASRADDRRLQCWAERSQVLQRPGRLLNLAVLRRHAQLLRVLGP